VNSTRIVPNTIAAIAKSITVPFLKFVKHDFSHRCYRSKMTLVPAPKVPTSFERYKEVVTCLDKLAKTPTDLLKAIVLIPVLVFPGYR